MFLILLFSSLQIFITIFTRVSSLILEESIGELKASELRDGLAAYLLSLHRFPKLKFTKILSS